MCKVTTILLSGRELTYVTPLKDLLSGTAKLGVLSSVLASLKFDRTEHRRD